MRRARIPPCASAMPAVIPCQFPPHCESGIWHLLIRIISKLTVSSPLLPRPKKEALARI